MVLSEVLKDFVEENQNISRMFCDYLKPKLNWAAIGGVNSADGEHPASFTQKTAIFLDYRRSPTYAIREPKE